jgi:hypothetical protein
MKPMLKHFSLLVLIALAAAGCNVNRALEQVHEARQLSSDLAVQFTKGADASNLAVLADTDTSSTAFVKEAENRTAAVQKDLDALQPLLDRLGFAEESRLLGEFRSRFDEYRKIDRTILDLAVENTNLKAQALASGTARNAADAVTGALGGLEPSADTGEGCQVKALAATVDARVREIEALQAYHIPAPDDPTMTELEKRMAGAEASARDALKRLGALVRPGSQAKVTAAAAALDRFIAANRQIVELSRRNTNLRSVALSLTEKRPAVAACEERLHALRAALAKRGYVSRRY